MAQEQEQNDPQDEQMSTNATSQQQQQPPQEGHAGQGSESIMKQLREWESRRANNSLGKRRNGPA
jgi:hypothetical protein